MRNNRVELDTENYYADVREGTKTELYLERASDCCLTLMDLLDNNEFDLSETEAKKVHEKLSNLCDQLLYRTKDE